MKANKPFLHPTEVAQLLGVTPSRVYQMIQAGELPATKVGGRIRIPTEAWAHWLKGKNDDALASVVEGDRSHEAPRRD